MGAQPKTTEDQGGTWGLWLGANLGLLVFFFLKLASFTSSLRNHAEIQGPISSAPCHIQGVDFSVKIQNISSLPGPWDLS